MKGVTCARCVHDRGAGWCEAARRSVAGGRHLRTCASFTPVPTPVERAADALAAAGLREHVAVLRALPGGVLVRLRPGLNTREASAALLTIDRAVGGRSRAAVS